MRSNKHFLPTLPRGMSLPTVPLTVSSLLFFHSCKHIASSTRHKQELRKFASVPWAITTTTCFVEPINNCKETIARKQLQILLYFLKLVIIVGYSFYYFHSKIRKVEFKINAVQGLINEHLTPWHWPHRLYRCHSQANFTVKQRIKDPWHPLTLGLLGSYRLLNF